LAKVVIQTTEMGSQCHRVGCKCWRILEGQRSTN